MPFSPSPLERWFTTHPGPYRHSLASTQAAPLAFAELTAGLAAPPAFSVGYSDPEGAPALRELVAAYHGVAVARVLLAHGAADANFLALAALVRPGDRVVCQSPIYPQLPLVAAGLGAEVLPWETGADPGTPVDLEALAALVDDRTRLIVLNSPHNPTGRVIAEAELRAIAAIAEARPACHLLVDEVYREVGHAPLPPSALAFSERAVITGSLSKAWALPGLRLGWLVGPAWVVEAALPCRELTTLALSSLSEGLALALWPRLDGLKREAQAVMARNRAIVRAWLATTEGVTGQVSEASGCCLMFPAGPFDDAAACERWYQQERLFVIPGSTIGYPGALRVGFGHRDALALASALAALGEKLSVDHPPRS